MRGLGFRVLWTAGGGVSCSGQKEGLGFRDVDVHCASGRLSVQSWFP